MRTLASISYALSVKLHWDGYQWSWVNIGSGNVLVQQGIKSLFEPLLTDIFVAVWHL